MNRYNSPRRSFSHGRLSAFGGRPGERSITNGLVIAACLTAAVLVWCLIEKASHERHLRKIPIRIAVTGTRGKSSVTRLVAASLREAGMTVVAKTTGSQPVLILPDGSEQEIRRRGLPTILEQKEIIRRASRLHAQALVMEMMSIREEFLFVESRRLLRPGTLVLTNVRLDHIDLMGKTRDDIAACLAAAFPKRGKIILPEDEIFSIFKERAIRLDSKLIIAPKALARDAGANPSFSYREFEENVRLAFVTARESGIDDAVSRRGMTAVKPDLGSLKAWRRPESGGAPPLVFVNAFAANDPESTLRAVARITGSGSWADGTWLGLLNLRGDRGDRARQWAEALESGCFDGFRRMAVVGGQARAFGFRMRKSRRRNGNTVIVLRERIPAGIFDRLAGFVNGPAVVVGMGNIGGLGRAVVEYWERTGIPHGF